MLYTSGIYFTTSSNRFFFFNKTKKVFFFKPNVSSPSHLTTTSLNFNLFQKPVLTKHLVTYCFSFFLFSALLVVLFYLRLYFSFDTYKNYDINGFCSGISTFMCKRWLFLSIHKKKNNNAPTAVNTKPLNTKSIDRLTLVTFSTPSYNKLIKKYYSSEISTEFNKGFKKAYTTKLYKNYFDKAFNMSKHK